jgi:hypothetical protein
MRLKSYSIAMLAFALALIISAGPMIAAATEKGNPEPGKASGGAGSQGTSVPEDGQKKEIPGAEASDEAQALKQKIIELQNKGKLGFRKIVLCRSVEGFGVYSPLDPGQPVSKIVFYCEPSNVSTMLSGERYVIDCAVDAFLMDSSGRTLLGKENMLKINRVSRSPVMDLFFKVEINFQKLPTRKMIAKIVLHDKIKNQSVTVTQRINLESGSKKGLDNI